LKTLKKDLLLQMIKFVNLVLMCVPFYFCWFYYYSTRALITLNSITMWLVVLIFAVLYTILGKIYDAFLIPQNKVFEMIYSQSLAVLIADLLTYVIIVILAQELVTYVPGAIAFCGQIVVSIIWSIFVHYWYYKVFGKSTTAIIYDVRKNLDKLIEQYGLDKKYDVKMNLSVEECLADISQLDGLETVFLSGVHSRDRNIILKYCIEHDITMFVIPRVGDTIMSGAHREHMLHLPILRVHRYHPSPEYLFIKRAIDIVFSLVVMIVLSPLFLITALAIKTDGGPVFYRQVRLTKDGKEFKVIKFRSMRVDAEKDGHAHLSSGDNDDRITKVGKIIRKVRVDELPQFLNIIGGSMSIVGPRPERPEIADLYEKEMPEFRLRLQAKAGLTGYAQVYGKYNSSSYDKLQMDLMYIANPSLIEDIKIILATVKIIFISDSTEGFTESQLNEIQSIAEEEADD